MESLNKFGFTFQIKCITALMHDPSFISRVYDMLKSEYFESTANRWIVSQILLYFKEYKTSPSFDVLKVQVQNLDDQLIQMEVVNSLREVLKYVEARDLPFIKDTTLQFCLNQELKDAILRSVDLLKLERYDDIKLLVDGALRKGQDGDVGLEYSGDVEERYTTDPRLPVSTGQVVLDELTKGGLAGGELGVVLAPSGIGKSWALAQLGAAAMVNGKSVLHYTLELSDKYVAQRYDCIHTGIQMDTLPDHLPAVQRRLHEIPGDLIVKRYPTKGVSLIGLRAHVDKLLMLGKRIDLIVLDYADLLKLPNSATQRKDEALQTLYEDLRGMAGELNIPIWTASQTNRSALEEDVIDTDKISESYGKVMTADFIMTISRKPKDKATDTARIFIAKSRLGPDGITLPCKFDTNFGILQIYGPESNEGQKITNATPSDHDYNRARLAKAYKNLFPEN